MWVENDTILDRQPGERIEISGQSEQTSGHRTRIETEGEALLAERAVKFIERHQGRPFFLYYPTSAVHNPHTPGVAWRGGLIMSDTMDPMATDVDQQELGAAAHGPRKKVRIPHTFTRPRIVRRPQVRRERCR